MQGEREYEEAWKVGKREARDIIDILSLENIYNENEAIDLDELLLIDDKSDIPQGIEDLEDSSWRCIERPIYDYRYIHYSASEKWRSRIFSPLWKYN